MNNKTKKYPVQVLISKEKERLCKLHSKKIVGCPRPNDGSFSHFVNFAIDEVLEKYVPEKYIKSIN